MNFPVTPEERAALLRAYDEAEATAYTDEIMARVDAETRDSTRMPWWFWEAAVVAVVLTLALSAAFPWGVAT
jgi:hypothetical protein